MTKIEVFKKGSYIRAVRVSGHSGFADEGFDIVCSAITSALMMTHVALVDVLNLNVETKVNDQNAEIFISVDDIHLKEAQTSFKAFHYHMQNVMLDYSDYIDITEV